MDNKSGKSSGCKICGARMHTETAVQVSAAIFSLLLPLLSHPQLSY